MTMLYITKWALTKKGIIGPVECEITLSDSVYYTVAPKELAYLKIGKDCFERKRDALDRACLMRLMEVNNLQRKIDKLKKLRFE